MDVDKVKFIEDVRRLKKEGIIVLDNDIITATGVAKSSLSEYLNESNPRKPSRPFLKKFYDAFSIALDTIKVAEPTVEYETTSAKNFSETDKAALQKLDKEELIVMYLRQVAITDAMEEQIKAMRRLLAQSVK